MNWRGRLDPRFEKLSFNHDLKRESPDHCWQCCICGKQWVGKPRTKCVGVPAFDTSDKRQEVKQRGLLSIHSAMGKNLRLKPGAVPIGHTPFTVLDPEWDLLFELDAFEVGCDYLPPISDKADHLKIMSELRVLDKRPRPGSLPAACYDKLTSSGGKMTWGLKYALDDCIEGYESTYITKSRLKDCYALSDGWLRRLGEPDFTVKNPHYSKGAPMQLYARERVEEFISQNAEEYQVWLEGRNKRQATARLVASKGKETRAKVNEQTRMCFQCDSSCAGDGGFFCAIHPLGWLPGVPQENFCPDFRKRQPRGTST